MLYSNLPMESPSLSQQILSALDVLRAVGVEGKNYAENEYDAQRYELTIDTVAKLYFLLSQSQEDPEAIRKILEKELGPITPKIGIDVGVIHHDKVLTLRRTDDQTYCLPCGWMSVGDSIQKTAIREVNEEAKIKISPFGCIKISTKGPEDYPSILHHQLNALVVSRPIDDELQVILSNEHDQHKWITSPDKVHWHAGHEQAAKTLFRFIKDPATVPMLELD